MRSTQHLSGIVAMIAAVALFAAMDALLKLLAGHYGPMQVSCLRGVASLPFVVAAIVLRGRLARVRPVNVRLHLVRGALSILMLWCFVMAVRDSSLAVTYSIFMFAPLLVVALAAPILGERAGRAQWTAVGVGLVGVLIMIAPWGGDWGSRGVLYAAIATACYAVSVVLMRLLSRTDSTESMVFWLTVLLSAGSGLLALADWQPVRVEDFPAIAGLGVTGALGQWLITEAFRRAPAAVVTPFEYTALLWGAVLDLAVWGVLPGAATLAGSSIVIAAGLYLIYRERRLA